jgi:signal transduction histidine kinase
MQEKGILTIVTAMIDMEGLEVKKEYVEIRIQDTGSGISEKNLAGIFDPFFTTKEKGTGLGMAIVQMIVENHGGEIQVISPVPGKTHGCRIVIHLPVSGAAHKPVPA